MRDKFVLENDLVINLMDFNEGFYGSLEYDR